MTSAGSSPGEEYVTVKKYEDSFLVSSIGNVDIRGKITKLEKKDDKTISIMVEGQKEPDTAYDKAYVRVDNDTKIYRASNDQAISSGDLKEGMNVEIKFFGPVNYSYPVQAKAGEVKVIDL